MSMKGGSVREHVCAWYMCTRMCMFESKEIALNGAIHLFDYMRIIARIHSISFSLPTSVSSMSSSPLYDLSN